MPLIRHAGTFSPLGREKGNAFGLCVLARHFEQGTNGLTLDAVGGVARA